MLSHSGTEVMNRSDQVGVLDVIESFIERDFGGRITRSLGGAAGDALAEGNRE